MTSSPAYFRRRWPLVAALAFVAVAAAAAIVPQLVSRGLAASYFYGPDWRDSPRLVEIDSPGAEDWLAGVGHRFDGRPYSATWQGWLQVDEAATYTFSVASDDGSWLYLDDALVVDNGGRHAVFERVGAVALTPGLHRFRLHYFQFDGGTGLMVRWARGDSALAPLPVDRLFPTRLAAVLQPRLAPIVDRLPDLHLGYLLALIASAAMLIAVGTGFYRHVARHVSAHASEPALNRWLWRLLALATALVVWEIWYGIPVGWVGWEGDELRARDVIPGLETLFSGGWYDHYPPLYFYALAALSVPFKLASLAGLDDLWSDRTTLTIAALYRSTSMICGVACVYLTYRCGSEAFGRRSTGLWAGLVVAVMPNFVYLAKLAKPELPYIVPFLVSMLFYLRCLRDPRPGLYGAFAAAGMVAICVKDQAYALYVFPAGHLVWLRWRASAGSASRLRTLLRDPALVRAAVISVVVFVTAHNLVFNLSGFRAHLALITGDGSRAFRAYAPTLAGQVLLLRDSLAQVPWLLGWPAALMALFGIGLGWRERRDATLALLLPVVSYYVTCIAVIGFHYDRFYLAPAMLLAVFAGHTLAFLMARPALWPRTLAVAAAAYSLALGASVNLLMMRDSRYAAETWLREHVDSHATVGYFEPLAYLPRPGALRFQELETDWAQVEAAAPEFLVVNTEFARRERTLAFYIPLFSGTHPRYQPVARFKSTPGPAALLANDRVFWNGVEDPFTNLDKINPDIQIYARRDLAARP
ncbi:MAG: PA14 domain-containing protein [Acidobacteriota bacterium]